LAPLYEVQPYSSDIFNKGGTLKLTKIDSALVNNGKPYYPILVTATTKNAKMRTGESNLLIVDVKVLDSFPSEIPKTSNLYIRQVDPNQNSPIKFKLESTTFEVASAGLDDKTLGIQQPTSYSWIIAPKSGAKGEQYCIINMDYGKFGMAVEVNLYVQEISGLSPVLVGILSSVGTFILGMLGLIKIFPEIWVAYGNAFNKSKKQSKKKRPT
jgi:hypothetical protein